MLALSPVKSFFDPREDPAEAAADSDDEAISVAGLLVPTPLEPLEPNRSGQTNSILIPLALCNHGSV